MWRQVGGLSVDDGGVAVRGLIVRHLVLPGGKSGSRRVFDFLDREISREVAVSVMSQYIPCYKAVRDPVLGRRITRAEYSEACATAERAGLSFGWFQDWADEPCKETLFGVTMEANV